MIEKLGDLIYDTLKDDVVTKGMGNRGYITDILCQAIQKAGYALTPKGDDEGILAFRERLAELGYSLSEEDFSRAFTAFKELARRDLTISKFRQAVYDAREGKELDLSEEAFEIFCMIQNDVLTRQERPDSSALKLEANSRLREISGFQDKWLSFDKKDRDLP